MVTLQILEDKSLIINLLQESDIHENVLGINTTQGWEIDTVRYLYLSIVENYNCIGIMIAQRFTPDTVIFHGGIYPPYRNGTTHLRLQSALEQISIMLKTNNLFTTVREDNTPAIKMVERAGFKCTGFIPSSEGSMKIYTR